LQSDPLPPLPLLFGSALLLGVLCLSWCVWIGGPIEIRIDGCFFFDTNGDWWFGFPVPSSAFYNSGVFLQPVLHRFTDAGNASFFYLGPLAGLMSLLRPLQFFFRTMAHPFVLLTRFIPFSSRHLKFGEFLTSTLKPGFSPHCLASMFLFFFSVYGPPTSRTFPSLYIDIVSLFLFRSLGAPLIFRCVRPC